jgi:hypothetical protein
MITKFDPFEKENCFYNYKLKINKIIIDQLYFLLSNHNNVEQKTTYNSLNVLNFPLLRDIKKQTLDILKKHNLSLTDNWAQMYNKNDYHDLHVHPGSIYSGIIYIDGKNSTSTTFYSKKFYPYEHKFNKNTLLLFPSAIPHQVKKLNNNEQRLIISFNTKD